jgi:hypothetical protein
VARNAAGVTAYAALQGQSFHTPAYSESDLVGGFGLSYATMNGTDTRSELGARFEDPALLGTMLLVLRAKIAWAPLVKLWIAQSIPHRPQRHSRTFRWMEAWSCRRKEQRRYSMDGYHLTDTWCRLTPNVG